MLSKKSQRLVMVSVLILALGLSGCMSFFGAKPASMAVTPEEIVIDLDDEDTSVTVKAEVYDKRGNPLAVDSTKIEWSVADPAIAAVEPETGAEAVVTGLAEGETTLTAAFGGISVDVPITVDGKEPEPPVPAATELIVTPDEVALDLDDETPSMELTAQVLDQFGEAMAIAGNDIAWSVSDETIAALSSANGFAVTVTALKEGETEITAAYGELSVVVPVTVDPAEPPAPEATELRITPVSVELDADTLEMELTAVVLDQFGESMTVDGEAITLTIADQTIAELSSTTGKTVTVTGVAAGVTTITVTYGALEEAITVSVDLPDVESVLPLTVDFSQFTQRSDIFGNAEYAHAPGNEEEPLFIVYSGQSGVTFQDQALKMTSTRWVVGMPMGLSNTDPDYVPNGYLDLSKPYVLVIELGAITGDGFLQVLVDNNTSSSSNSPHGTSSQIYNSEGRDDFQPETTLVIESSVGTETSFLCFRASSGITISIKSITIDYQE